MQRKASGAALHMNGSIRAAAEENLMTKVTLLISRFAMNTGSGGHYYSYQALADALQDQYEVRLMAVGTAFPHALDTIRDKVDFVQAPASPAGRRALEARLAQTGDDSDCFIALDQMAAMFLRRHCRSTGAGLVAVKAGGPWPRRYVPNMNVQVHFALKDHQRVEARNAAGAKRSFYVPNRVRPIAAHSSDAQDLAQELDIAPDELVIIRIGRVSEVYRAAFEGTLALRRVLSEAGYKSRAIMIGTPESPDLATELSAACAPGLDHLLTDPAHTQSASRYLPVAQINVGVGRGFMEGASLGQYMFAMANNSGLPVRVGNDTVETFLGQNISMRVCLERPEAQRHQEILDVAKAISAGRRNDPDAQTWFDTWFSAARIPERYSDAITAAMAQPETLSADYLLSEFWLWLYPIEQKLRRMGRIS